MMTVEKATDALQQSQCESFRTWFKQQAAYADAL